SATFVGADMVTSLKRMVGNTDAPGFIPARASDKQFVEHQVPSGLRRRRVAGRRGCSRFGRLLCWRDKTKARRLACRPVRTVDSQPRRLKKYLCIVGQEYANSPCIVWNH